MALYLRAGVEQAFLAVVPGRTKLLKNVKVFEKVRGAENGTPE
jgi:hypothetical protein